MPCPSILSPSYSGMGGFLGREEVEAEMLNKKSTSIVLLQSTRGCPGGFGKTKPLPQLSINHPRPQKTKKSSAWRVWSFARAKEV